MPDRFTAAAHTRRVLRVAGAACLLIGVLFAAPVGLLLLNSHPIPAHLKTPTPRNGSVMAAWLVWAVLVIIVVLDLLGRLRSRAPLRLPGLGLLQRAVTALISATGARPRNTAHTTGTADDETVTGDSPLEFSVAIPGVPSQLTAVASLDAAAPDAASQNSGSRHAALRDGASQNPASRNAASQHAASLHAISQSAGLSHGASRNGGEGRGEGRAARRRHASVETDSTSEVSVPVSVPNALDPTAGITDAHQLISARRQRASAREGFGRRPNLDSTGSEPSGEIELDTHDSAQITRLDLALRDLASKLCQRDEWIMPDIMGAWLAVGDIHLLLAEPCAEPPQPWISHGLVWTLPADAPTNTWLAGTTPPLPGLITIARDDDRRLLLDLERLGVLTIGGDDAGAIDLLCHIGAEMAHSIWSDDVAIGIAGFGADDTRRLTALGHGRIRTYDSIAEALDEAGRWINEAQERMSGLDGGWLFGERVRATPAEARRLLPFVLLIASPSDDDMTRLERVDSYLESHGRGQLAIAAINGTGANVSRWPVRVAADRALTIDFLEAWGAALETASTRPAPDASDEVASGSVAVDSASVSPASSHEADRHDADRHDADRQDTDPRDAYVSRHSRDRGDENVLLFARSVGLHDASPTEATWPRIATGRHRADNRRTPVRQSVGEPAIDRPVDDQETAIPAPVTPERRVQQRTAPKSAAPTPVTRNATAPHATAPHATGPHATAASATAVKPTASKTAVPKPPVPKTAVPKTAVPKTSVSKLPTSRSSVSMPVAAKPVAAKPVAAKTTEPKPVAEKPTIQKPTVQKSTGQKPAIAKPTVQKPTVLKPPVQKPATRNVSREPEPDQTSAPRRMRA